MYKHGGFLETSTFVLALLSTGFLIFNMLAMRLFVEEVFIERRTFSSVEVLILVGFVLILLFDISAFLWGFSRLRQYQDVPASHKATLILGAFCLVFLMGEKVMIDEIGRECLLGWEVLGEWIILYAFLMTQLIYNLLVLLRLLQIRRSECGSKRRSPVS
jgi:hypothetical protein